MVQCASKARGSIVGEWEVVVVVVVRRAEWKVWRMVGRAEAAGRGRMGRERFWVWSLRWVRLLGWFLGWFGWEGGVLDVEVHEGMHGSLGLGVVGVVVLVVAEEEDEGGVGVGEAVEVADSGESLWVGRVCWREEQEVGGLVGVSAVRGWRAQGEVMRAQVCLWIGSVCRLSGPT